MYISTFTFKKYRFLLLVGLLFTITLSDSIFAQVRKIDSSKQTKASSVIVITNTKNVNDTLQKPGSYRVNTNSGPLVIQRDDILLDRNYMLSIYILIFGFLIILGAISLVFFGKMSADIVIKIITISVATTSSLFLVVAGYSAEQIAPAFGLLGTLVGYLLGQKNSTQEK